MHVLVLGSRAPIAADLARALAAAGHRVWLADSAWVPVAGGVGGVAGHVRLPAPRRQFGLFRRRLAELCAARAIDVVIPVSEEVFWLTAAADALPAGTQARTSSLAVLAELHDKARFAGLAAQLGYGAETNVELRSAADLAAVANPESFVFKPVFSRFASRVLIRPSRARVARLRPSAADPWLAQSFVAGRELCAYNVADRGRLLLHVAYEPAFRFGVGASVYFSPVTSAPLRLLCERFIAATGFTGQISFDVIDAGDRLVALECNPRGTSGVHLAVQAPDALAAALLGEAGPVGPTTFMPEPRMLLLPLLLQSPGLVLRARGRDALAGARDALAVAGVSPGRQLGALAEMAVRALGAGLGLTRATTADIEWNGEEIA